MPRHASYPPLQFAAFRIALGAYLTVYFGSLVSYAGELLSAEGMVPDIAMNPGHVPLPNMFLLASSPAAAALVATVAAVIAGFFTLGLFRRASAGVLWYAVACVAHRNTLFPDPSTPFTGWLLLETILVPPGEPLTLTNRSRTPHAGWQFPRAIFVAAWVVLGVTYSVSGVIKLPTPEWTDGRAFALFLANALHRDGLIWSALSGLPAPLLSLFTWAGLGVELFAAPLALWRWTRPLAWLGLVTLHLLVLATMRTTMLSLGALLPLVFTFDAGWLAALRAPLGRGQPPDQRLETDKREPRRDKSRARGGRAAARRADREPSRTAR